MAKTTLSRQRRRDTGRSLEPDLAERLNLILARAEDNALDAFADFTAPQRVPNVFSASAAATAIAAVRDIRIARRVLGGAL